MQANIRNVANMNWCKFIAGFLHTALSKGIYNKGCRLHLMASFPHFEIQSFFFVFCIRFFQVSVLTTFYTFHFQLTYLDNLDLRTVDLTAVGGLPVPHKFAASAGTDAAIKAVLAADVKLDGSFGKLQASFQYFP